MLGSLFRAFSKCLTKKTVLIISPFVKSIEANFHNRLDFFKNYEYPDFSLVTFNTPITYSGLPEEFYPHANWFETLHALKECPRHIDFDIALMACGSYAVLLGLFIEKDLERQT